MADKSPSSDGPDEFPTEEELPDETITVDDIDPFTVDDDDFEEIDEFATAEWKQQTTAEERIHSIIKRTPTPKSADEIADTAHTSKKKAKTTLNNLVEEGVIKSHQTHSGILYEQKRE